MSSPPVKIPNIDEAPLLSEAPGGSGRFALIDAIRGIAALGIACHHIHRYGPLPAAADQILPSSIPCLLDNCRLAVQFFFVITGFVAAYSLRRVRITAGFAANFGLRRLLRLGIPYWFTVLFVHLLSYGSMHTVHDETLTEELTSPQIMAQFCFLQDILGYNNVSAGMWFVAIDLQFGLLFVVLLGLAERITGGRCDGRPRDQMALLASTLPLALCAVLVINRNPLQNMWIWYYFHLPALGALAYWAWAGRVPREAFWILAAAMALEMVCCWRLRLFVAALAGVLLYLSGRAGKLGALDYRPLQYLGRISYSLFLIHYPVSCLVLNLGYRSTGSQPAAAILWLMAALGASLGAAHLLYVFLEAPANRLVHRLKPPDP